MGKKEFDLSQPAFTALVSDLDDTLLTADHQMSARTVATLRRLLGLGVKVVLATGRSGASARPFVRQIATPYPYIAFNGAQILDARTDRVLHATELSVDLAARVLRFFEERGVYAQLYDGDDWYFDTPGPYAQSYGLSTGIPGTLAPAPLSGFVQRPTPKILAVDTPERVQDLIREGREAFGDRLSIAMSKPYFVEVTSPEANKGAAVKRLASMIGLSPETTLCAGDSINDLSMLAWSRYPVAVQNAREEVRALAWRVAGHGHRDGLALLLDELFPAKQDEGGFPAC